MNGQIEARIIAIVNQKGGVGKSTTAVNLGAALALLGRHVLVIDIDPQGNTTSGFGVDKAALAADIYAVLLGEVPIEKVICATGVANLDLVPATIALAGAEIELVSVLARELRLKRALEPVASRYDYVFIDCPPSLGLLTLNALTAANEVLIPVQAEYYALEGLSQLTTVVRRIRDALNPRLAHHRSLGHDVRRPHEACDRSPRRSQHALPRASVPHANPAQHSAFGGAVVREAGGPLRRAQPRRASISRARARVGRGLVSAKRGLGRGLGALLGAERPAGDTVAQIAVDAIRPNPRQPRTNFDAEVLGELERSIRELGVLVPLIVRLPVARRARTS